MGDQGACDGMTMHAVTITDWVFLPHGATPEPATRCPARRTSAGVSTGQI